jgi:hypothetical protein
MRRFRSGTTWRSLPQKSPPLHTHTNQEGEKTKKQTRKGGEDTGASKRPRQLSRPMSDARHDTRPNRSLSTGGGSSSSRELHLLSLQLLLHLLLIVKRIVLEPQRQPIPSFLG